MLKYLIFSIISFSLGIFAREIIEILERNKRYKTVKKLSEQNFKKAMEDLEIKYSFNISSISFFIFKIC